MAEVREDLAVLIGNCNFHGSAPLSVITHDYRGLAGKRQQSWIFCKIRIELCSGMRYNDKKAAGRYGLFSAGEVHIR